MAPEHSEQLSFKESLIHTLSGMVLTKYCEVCELETWHLDDKCLLRHKPIELDLG